MYRHTINSLKLIIFKINSLQPLPFLQCNPTFQMLYYLTEFPQPVGRRQPKLQNHCAINIPPSLFNKLSSLPKVSKTFWGKLIYCFPANIQFQTNGPGFKVSPPWIIVQGKRWSVGYNAQNHFSVDKNQCLIQTRATFVWASLLSSNLFIVQCSVASWKSITCF